MRENIILVLITALLLPYTAFAAITEIYDPSSNKTNVSSTFNQINYFNSTEATVGQFEKVIFSRTKGAYFYKLDLYLVTQDKLYCNKAEISFKGANYPLQVIENSSTTDEINNDYITKISLDLSSAGQSLLTNNSAIITLEIDNQGTISWDIGEDILNEWKTVIKY